MFSDQGRFRICILLASFIVTTDAFAAYLLSKTGCWTELDPEEVIMNNGVKPVAETDDPQMQIRIVGKELSITNHQYVIDHFPAEVELEVVTDNPATAKDYQVVMDVSEEGHFDRGRCDNNKRVAGKAKETFKLTVESSGAHVVAGWAAGHEAVRLTPVLRFVEAAALKPETSNETDQTTTSRENGAKRWVDEMVTELGCKEYSLSNRTASAIAGHAIDPVRKGKLTLGDDNLVDSTIPAEVKITFEDDDIQFEYLVLSTTEGASFAEGLCGGSRIIVAPNMAWPSLTIHEKSEIKVWATYSLMANPVLRQTHPLELLWSEEKDNETQGKLENERTEVTGADPQKLVDEKHRIVTDLKAHVQKHNEGKQIEPKIEHNASKKDRRAREKEKKRYKQENSNRHRLDDQKQFDKVAGAPNNEKGEELIGDFSMRSYYLGLVILIGLGFAITQLCLIGSQQGSKGRRDL